MGKKSFLSKGEFWKYLLLEYKGEYGMWQGVKRRVKGSMSTG